MNGIYTPKPGLITVVPRLLQDVKALMTLTELDVPVLRVIWPTFAMQVFYGFEDASGKQFGPTVAKSYDYKLKLSDKRLDSSGLTFQIGIWTAKQESESYKYKEFGNLVDTTEAEGTFVRLNNYKFFLFTGS